MNNELDRFEEILKELKPAPLSDETTSAIEKIPKTTPVDMRPRLIKYRGLLWAAAAVIALVLAQKLAEKPKPPGNGLAENGGTRTGQVATAPHEDPTVEPAKDDLSGPFRAKELFTAVHDEGVVDVDNGPPLRRLRRDYIRELQIRDPGSGKTYTVQEPRSDIVFVTLEQY